jgi:hypothetical protein
MKSSWIGLVLLLAGAGVLWWWKTRQAAGGQTPAAPSSSAPLNLTVIPSDVNSGSSLADLVKGTLRELGAVKSLTLTTADGTLRAVTWEDPDTLALYERVYGRSFSSATQQP